jgi:RNA polymerase sigma-70 factor (ECF subfamily)
MDEIALIQSAQQGDLNAFNHLVMVYQELIFNQAYRLLGEFESAEDASQEAFISAYRHLNGYRGGSFKAWLLRIVTNNCYDELRRRKRRPTIPLEPVDDDEQEIESPSWLADTSGSPEDLAERADLSRAIQNCLDELPVEFRAAVTLVDVQGLDYMEAAQAMGKPLGTIKSRLARARLRLRDCLQGFAVEVLAGTFSGQAASGGGE